MRLMDAEVFFADLQSEGCDVLNIDYRCSLYSEFGYSSELIEKVIERQIFVEARPMVHGKWDEQADGSHFCSNCGYDAPYDYEGNEFTPSFCCHCAAIMDLKEEGTDE